MSMLKQKTDHNALISPILLSVVFGLSAGVVGMLLIVAYGPDLGPQISTMPVRQASSGAPTLAPVPASVASAARSSALVFRVQRLGASVVERNYVPSEAVGAAMVLTSDGWLLSNDAVFTDAVRNALASYRIVIGTAAYPIETTVVDPFTGIVFLKVGGTNLPVTSFDGGARLAAGTSVFLLDAAGGPRRADVIGYDDRPAKDAASLVRSSERMQKVLRLSGIDGVVPAGSMVIDASGDVLAVFAGDDASGSTAVPIAAVNGQISSVLRDGRLHRPYLGVHSIDLSRILGITDFGARPRGALLMATTDGRLAVQRRSPADDAGLRDGDIILAVNGEELGAQTALADLLADYAPGSVLTLTVHRGEADLPPMSVTIGEVP